jgi:hypothetical protein
MAERQFTDDERIERFDALYASWNRQIDHTSELKAERDRLREALEEIAAMDRQGYALRPVDRARAVLGPGSEGE